MTQFIRVTSLLNEGKVRVNVAMICNYEAYSSSDDSAGTIIQLNEKERRLLVAEKPEKVDELIRNADRSSVLSFN